MSKYEEKKDGCEACQSVINTIKDLALLGTFLDDMIERGLESNTKHNTFHPPEEMKRAFNRTIRIDVDAIPCSCNENIAKDDLSHGRISEKKGDQSCACLQMSLKKEILNDLKKTVKEKIQEVYNLNKKFHNKIEIDTNEEQIVKKHNEDIEDQELPIPYEILKNQLHEMHFKNLKGKKMLMRRLIKKRVPRHLLYCDEDSFREEIGKHRLLPKLIKTNFILERAFKNRESLEEELYEGFVRATKGQSLCASILSREPRRMSVRRSKRSTVTSLSKEDSKEKINLYLFPDHVPDPKTAKCECQRVGYKIARLEYIKELLYLVLESRTHVEQVNLMNCANALLKIITHEQMEENKAKLQNIDSDSSTDYESDSHVDRKKKRLQGSPSFERFRRNLLHEMHVERRPLSWFEKRRLYFHQQNPRRLSKQKSSINLEEKKEYRRKRRVEKAVNEAITELLELNYSKPYSRLENPDEYVLKKLTSIVKIFLKAESNEEDKVKEMDKEEICGWPFGKMLKRKSKWYELLEEARACGDLIQEEFPTKKSETSSEFKEEECRCISLQDKLSEHDKVVRDVQTLFIDAVIYWESSDDSSKKENDDEGLLEIEESKERYFKAVDLFKLKINFWEHIEKGEATESYRNDFGSAWEYSVINGLFEFNREIQVTEKERIIIRQQREKGVKIMSGGRVGLEPLYSEYVAKGMLDCLVLGDKHNGPSVRNILQAMLEIGTDDGILIIIMNEHEYRLNFMIAMQEAQELGVRAELVLAKDDASNEKYEERETGRQGSTGIVLQFKVAGAMADEGYNLLTICRTCQFMFIASVSCFIDEHRIYIGTNFKPGSGNIECSSRTIETLKKIPSNKKTKIKLEQAGGEYGLKDENIPLEAGKTESSSTNIEAPKRVPLVKKTKIKLEQTGGEYILKDENIPLEGGKFVEELSLDVLGRLPQLITRANQDSDKSTTLESDRAERDSSTLKEGSLLMIVRRMVHSLINDQSPHYMALEPGSDIILLLNNQNFTYDQMYIVAKEIAEILQEIDVKLGRVYIGNFVGLAKDGFSITIAKDLDKRLTHFLDQPTTCSHWPPHPSSSSVCTKALSKKRLDSPLGASIHPDYLPVYIKIFDECIQELKKHKKSLSCKEPNLATQVDYLIENIPPKYVLKKVPMDRPLISLVDLGKELEVLDGFGLSLSLFFTCAAQEFKINSKLYATWRMFCIAFYRGACSLAAYLKYERGNGCILDVLLPIAQACFDTKPGWNPLRSLKDALDGLDGASWLKKEEAGIKFCLVVAKSIYRTLDDSFGKLDWTAWEEKDEKMLVVVTRDIAHRRYRFATEKIQPEIKEALSQLEYTMKTSEKEVISS